MVHIAKGVTVGVIYGASWFASVMVSFGFVIGSGSTPIDERSLVPVGIAIGITVFTGTLIWKISAWKSEIENKHSEAIRDIASTRMEVSEVKTMLVQFMRERKYEADSIRAEMGTNSKPLTMTEDTYRPLVLIVDDNEQDRALAKINLRSHGFRVVEAASLKDANEQLVNHKVDCTLLDLSLTGGGKRTDGAETVLEFARAYPDALCVALSGNEDPVIKAEVLAAGADSFAFKIKLDDTSYLPKMIRAAMDRHALKLK